MGRGRVSWAEGASCLAFGIVHSVEAGGRNCPPPPATGTLVFFPRWTLGGRQSSNHVTLLTTFGVGMSPHLDAGTPPGTGTLSGRNRVSGSCRRVGEVRATQSPLREAAANSPETSERIKQTHEAGGLEPLSKASESNDGRPRPRRFRGDSPLESEMQPVTGRAEECRNPRAEEPSETTQLQSIVP